MQDNKVSAPSTVLCAAAAASARILIVGTALTRLPLSDCKHELCTWHQPLCRTVCSVQPYRNCAAARVQLLITHSELPYTSCRLPNQTQLQIHCTSRPLLLDPIHAVCHLVQRCSCTMPVWVLLLSALLHQLLLTSMSQSTPHDAVSCHKPNSATLHGGYAWLLLLLPASNQLVNCRRELRS